MQWRNISKAGIHELWKELCGKMKEEILEKYIVQETKKGAYKERREPVEGQITKKEKKHQPEK